MLAQVEIKPGDALVCVAYDGPDDYYTIGKTYRAHTHRGVTTVRNNKGCRSFEARATFNLQR